MERIHTLVTYYVVRTSGLHPYLGWIGTRRYNSCTGWIEIQPMQKFWFVHLREMETSGRFQRLLQFALQSLWYCHSDMWFFWLCAECGKKIERIHTLVTFYILVGSAFMFSFFKNLKRPHIPVGTRRQPIYRVEPEEHPCKNNSTHIYACIQLLYMNN